MILVFLLLLSFIITIIGSLAFGLAHILDYLTDSLTFPDTLIPAILLIFVAIHFLFEAFKLSRYEKEEEDELIDEPIIVFPKRRSFRRKSNRKKKN